MHQAVRKRFGGAPLPPQAMASAKHRDNDDVREKKKIQKKKRAETESSEEEPQHRRKRSDKNEALDALKMLHVEQQAARTAEIDDVMRLEKILAAGRDNKLKALREEVRLRAQRDDSSMMMQ